MSEMDMRRAARAIRRRLRRLQAGLLWSKGPAVAAVAGRGRALAGNTDWLMRRHLDDVVGALSAGGVSHFVVPGKPGQRPRVGVNAGDRRLVVKALKEHRAGKLFLKVPGLPAAAVSRVDPRYLQDSAVVRVFTYARAGRRVFAGDYACDIEFWTATDSGTLLAPRPNPIARRVPPPFATPTHIQILGGGYPSLRAFDVPDHVDRMPFDVDLVYTWVDGSDPQWRRRQRDAREAAGHADWHAHAANDSRYVDREELRYSLRSMWMYADVFRRVYIVTDNQVPSWLRTDHPQVHVVDHTEIFDDLSVLPTFNSHAIESRLHRIDGLSEHFVYANDDMFWGRRLPVQTFFASNGLSRFFPAPSTLTPGPPTAHDNPAEVAAKNNRDLLTERVGEPGNAKIRHIPYALRRQVLDEMEATFPEAFASTASHRFRAPDDVSVASNFFHHYAYLTGRAIPADASFRYVDISRTRAAALRVALSSLRRRPPDFFCINDVEGDVTPAAERVVRDFFEAMYPIPSPFELEPQPRR